MFVSGNRLRRLPPELGWRIHRTDPPYHHRGHRPGREHRGREPGEHPTTVAGFGTFLVIFLHKPFDAVTITTLMTLGSWKRSGMHLVNGLFALMVPLGAMLFHLGLSYAGEGANWSPTRSPSRRVLFYVCP